MNFLQPKLDARLFLQKNTFVQLSWMEGILAAFWNFHGKDLFTRPYELNEWSQKKRPGIPAGQRIINLYMWKFLIVLQKWTFQIRTDIVENPNHFLFALVNLYFWPEAFYCNCQRDKLSGPSTRTRACFPTQSKRRWAKKKTTMEREH